MRLQVFLPTEILIDEEVSRIVAEGQNGSFGLLPRHIDFVSSIVPGIVVFTDAEGRERFVGTDHGTLVKHGEEVRLSTRRAVRGKDLDTLREVVERTYLELNERERSARSALARLEAGVVRRFIDLAG